MYKIESTALTLFVLCIKRVFLDEYLEKGGNDDAARYSSGMNNNKMV